jgi:hypothetical protein
MVDPQAVPLVITPRTAHPVVFPRVEHDERLPVGGWVDGQLDDHLLALVGDQDAAEVVEEAVVQDRPQGRRHRRVLGKRLVGPEGGRRAADRRRPGRPAFTIDGPEIPTG